MAFFGLFSPTYQPTALEALCETFSVERALASLPAEPLSKDLAAAYSMMLLHLSSTFWNDLRGVSSLKVYCRKTSANVIIFETLLFSWSLVTHRLMSAAIAQGVDENSPRMDALTLALPDAMAVLEKNWTAFHANDYLADRQYPLSTQMCIDKFLGRLAASLEQQLPINGPCATLSLDQLYLTEAVTAYVAQTLPKIDEGLMQLARSRNFPLTLED